MLNNLLLSSLIGAVVGTLSAFFLVTLEAVTGLRVAHPMLIWFLPAAGFSISFVYWRFGRSVEGGTDLVLDEIHEPRRTLPARLIPLILIGTLITHLFGGSAGREGTAVQMGAALADQVARRFKKFDRTTFLMAGLSAGFGSVFGVPFAGTLFGLEVLAIGGLRFRCLLDCAVASFTAHFVCLAWGIRHTAYEAPVLPSVDVKVLGCVIASGLAFGTIASLFSFLMHQSQSVFRRIQFPPLRALLGGVLVVTGFYFVSWDRYAGLGIGVVTESLRHPLPSVDWFWKSVFTILTSASGFKGGEVTPLLFIGATFGNFLSQVLPIGFSLLSALGFVAVFAGAANTPLACTIMAMEIFGPGIGLLALLACSCSWLVSGHRGIYRSQKIARRKPLSLV